MNKIVEAVSSCRGKILDEVLEENDIMVDEFKFESAYGAILIGKSTFIFLDKHLGKMKEFVTWHELGHLMLEGKGLYCFKDIYDEKELKANVFACLMVGSNRFECIRNGCPVNIAYEVDKYISQNVCKNNEIMKYYDIEVIKHA